MSSHRLALDPPTEALAILDHALIDTSVRYARESPRRRVIAPFHRSEDEILHRMLNAVQPGSYVRPHRHLDPPKAEAWIVLRGSLLFFTFREDGAIDRQVVLSAAGPRFGVDLSPGIYHSLLVLEPDTVMYEVKSGPYEKLSDKSFAPWAPADGSAEVASYMAGLLAAARARDPSLPEVLP